MARGIGGDVDAGVDDAKGQRLHGRVAFKLGGGVQADTVFTPATFAGMMLICAEPNIG